MDCVNERGIHGNRFVMQLCTCEIKKKEQRNNDELRAMDYVKEQGIHRSVFAMHFHTWGIKKKKTSALTGQYSSSISQYSSISNVSGHKVYDIT